MSNQVDQYIVEIMKYGNTKRELMSCVRTGGFRKEFIHLVIEEEDHYIVVINVYEDGSNH